MEKSAVRFRFDNFRLMGSGFVQGQKMRNLWVMQQTALQRHEQATLKVCFRDDNKTVRWHQQHYPPIWDRLDYHRQARYVVFDEEEIDYHQLPNLENEMWLEVHNDIEGRPSYTVIPDDISDAFRQFCQENEIEVELERGVFRSDGKSYDFGTFRNNAVEDVRDLVEEWNRKQRKASR